MRRDTKIVTGLLVFALVLAGGILWRTDRRPDPPPSSRIWAFPGDPCQVLTIDELNAVAEIPADSYYRQLPILAHGDYPWDPYDLGNIGIAQEKVPIFCYYQQLAAQATPVKPPPPIISSSWEAEWYYRHLAAGDWEQGKEVLIRDGECWQAENIQGSEDALWCDARGFFVRHDDVMLGFRVRKVISPFSDERATVVESESGARTMAARVTGHMQAGSFPPSPPQSGPVYGTNMLIAPRGTEPSS
ncbi:hypothetical protein [Kitasatospora griseola]|uniref:hypothetical protein n=1 Tax=Kitasatospora griseola TaxID=2064 RepID=UPI003431A60F